MGRLRRKHPGSESSCCQQPRVAAVRRVVAGLSRGLQAGSVATPSALFEFSTRKCVELVRALKINQGPPRLGSLPARGFADGLGDPPGSGSVGQEDRKIGLLRVGKADGLFLQLFGALRGKVGKQCELKISSRFPESRKCRYQELPAVKECI